MRMSKTMPIGAFRAFLETRPGLTFEKITTEGEIIRFRIGNARGFVAQRKDGSYTLRTMAVDLYREFQKESDKSC